VAKPATVPVICTPRLRSLINVSPGSACLPTMPLEHGACWRGKAYGLTRELDRSSEHHVMPLVLETAQSVGYGGHVWVSRQLPAFSVLFPDTF
jgi:hypothetical protein